MNQVSLPERHDIEARLTTEDGLSSEAAAVLVSELQEAVPEIQAAFLRWWEGEPVAAPEVGGYSVDRLHAERGYGVVAALMVLDWLAKEPVAAQRALQHLPDRIVVSDEG